MGWTSGGLVMDARPQEDFCGERSSWACLRRQDCNSIGPFFFFACNLLGLGSEIEHENGIASCLMTSCAS